MVSMIMLSAAACTEEPNNEGGSSEVRVESILIQPDELTLKAGETGVFTYEITPADAANQNATWNSQNTSIATIDQSGTVTGIAPGTAMITVESEDGNFLDMAYVTVLEADVKVTGVTLNLQNIRLMLGDTRQLEYEIEPVNATNTNVIWSSGDEAVATVSAEGLVTAMSIGETVITATTEDGGFTATCNAVVQEVGRPTFTLEMVEIPAGTFMMGAPETEEGFMDETQHEVTLTKDFYMSAYEVTTTQYAEFLNAVGIGQDGMGEVTYTDNGQEITDTKLLVTDSSNPDASLGGTWDHGLHWNVEKDMWEPAPGCEKYAIGHVSWYGAVAFCNWYGASLPTEAQWEYAYRAGSEATYPWGDDPALVNDYGWIYQGGGEMPQMHNIGEKRPNAWGLYDMVGSLMEYCADWYGPMTSEAVTDPVGPATGEYRVLRGSCITHNYLYTRCAYRDSYDPDKGTGAGGLYGFRVVSYNK